MDVDPSLNIYIICQLTLYCYFSDVTAVGGESLKENDYVAVDHSHIEFKHQEKFKTIDVKVNKEAKVLKLNIVHHQCCLMASISVLICSEFFIA